ncbi:unnamed protein product, partial [Vitis vinifera]|uniref:Uncharacterized protein n=1 Tax=Vitis vinifera TaxID=29760 RepID=D7U0A6_VITVI
MSKTPNTKAKISTSKRVNLRYVDSCGSGFVECLAGSFTCDPTVEKDW